MKDMDACRTQFSVEQDDILVLLSQLEREEEYLKTHVPVGSIFSEQYPHTNVENNGFLFMLKRITNTDVFLYPTKSSTGYYVFKQPSTFTWLHPS